MLDYTQREINDRLFESGVISRVMGNGEIYGVEMDTSDMGQLDKLFVPSAKDASRDGVEAYLLLLTALLDDPNKRSRAYAQRDIGLIGADGKLEVIEGISPEDAILIYNEAAGLQRLRTGSNNQPPLLPNLSFDLLRINNPNTDIMRMNVITKPNPYRDLRGKF